LVSLSLVSLVVDMTSSQLLAVASGPAADSGPAVARGPAACVHWRLSLEAGTLSCELRRLSRLPLIVESDRHLGSDVTIRSDMSSVIRPSLSRYSSYSWTTHTADYELRMTKLGTATHLKNGNIFQLSTATPTWGRRKYALS